MANLSIIQSPTGKSALVLHGLTLEDQEREDADPNNVHAWSNLAKDLGLDGGIYTTLQFDNALELEFAGLTDEAWQKIDAYLRLVALEEALDASEDRYDAAVERDAQIIQALRDKVDDLEIQLAGKDAKIATLKRENLANDHDRVAELEARVETQKTNLERLNAALEESEGKVAELLPEGYYDPIPPAKDQVEQAWRNQAGTIRYLQREVREARDQVRTQADTIGRYQYEASQRTP